MQWAGLDGLPGQFWHLDHMFDNYGLEYMLFKEIVIETLKHVSLLFREFSQLFLWLLCRYLWITSLS